MFESTSKIKSQPIFTATEIATLNKKYKPLTAKERVRQLYIDFKATDVLLTSSFGATSAFLLKLVSGINKNQKIYFIDTCNHFDETINYKNELTNKYELDVVSISASKEEQEFIAKDETWKKNPEFCCSINKVQPLDRVKQNHNIWMSGLMEWQSDHRASLDIFEMRGGILKFYPLLDVSKEQRDAYIEEHQLPIHPLVAKGYDSIGCKHCTVAGSDRSGRWNNKSKTECGLHL